MFDNVCLKLFPSMYLQSMVFDNVYHVWNIDGRHNDL